MFGQWCSWCHKRGLPVLEICVSNLVEYLDYLQLTHDYAYMTLCMHAMTLCIHASAIYSILQPTEQTGTLTAPLVQQLLKGGVQKETTSQSLGWYLRCKEGPKPNICLGKAFSLGLYSSNPQDRHEHGLSHGQEGITPEFKDYSKGYADNCRLSYFPISVWG